MTTTQSVRTPDHMEMRMTHPVTAGAQLTAKEPKLNCLTVVQTTRSHKLAELTTTTPTRQR